MVRMDCPDHPDLQVCWGHRVRLVSKVNEVCKANKARRGPRANEDRQGPLVSINTSWNLYHVKQIVDVHKPTRV